ncbi:MAG: preprotein translocase subunit SecA [Christensenellales bacterium]|jgi:preprotein translocase subunit SecA
MGFLDRLFGKEKERQLKKLKAIADKIEALEDKFSALDDEQLRAQTQIFKDRLKGGESLDDILPEAFAVVREASKRVLNMRHFYVQLIGGIVLHQGRIAEMKTGEGKTLAATLPAYLNALEEKGVHIVTVNDYLAARDAEWMGKIYKFLGLSVGVILNNMPQEEKKAAYNADITYATNNELGFDYLRDNMATKLEHKMQRGQNFAIIDEVDSILIDEARTPLIISAPVGKSSEIYFTVNRYVNTLREEDYTIDEKDKNIYLTESGVEKAERFFRIDNLSTAENADLNLKINSALRANKIMQRDKDYIVENGEVIIVDEFTGRKMIGRRYSEGLHQAIEAKENVKVNKENKTIATITFQNLFRLYKKLSGMTGTAMTEEGEFRGIYELDVIEIPTNMPLIRRDEPDKVYLSLEKKYDAVIAEIAELHAKGQPLLVGTVDVDVSEHLSAILKKKKIVHNVLNAKSHAREAEIIAQAGRKGAVTIATNMAGRGTDILLGGNPEYMAKRAMENLGYTPEEIYYADSYITLKEENLIAAREKFKELVKEYKEITDAEKAEVKKLGGLRVIGTTRHESRRIDNQLRGRSGRQGDEGSSIFYLSFEDELLRRFGGDRLKAMVTALTRDEDTVIQMPLLAKQIESAQKRCEENNFERRKYVLNYDDVMNKQRELIYSQRDDVLKGADVHEQIKKFIRPICSSIVSAFVDFREGDDIEIDLEGFNSALEQKILKKGTNLITAELCGKIDVEAIENAVYEEACRQYDEKLTLAESAGIDFRETERNVLLNQVDRHWMDHIDAMDALKQGVGLRGYGQKDPVMEYRREGFEMFDTMVESIQNNTAIVLCKIDVEQVIERRNAYMERQKREAEKVTVVSDGRPGRNSPCPCGSGKKYKVCCGK